MQLNVRLGAFSVELGAAPGPYHQERRSVGSLPKEPAPRPSKPRQAASAKEPATATAGYGSQGIHGV